MSASADALKVSASRSVSLNLPHVILASLLCLPKLVLLVVTSTIKCKVVFVVASSSQFAALEIQATGDLGPLW